MTSVGTSPTEAARAAFSRGLLASGIAVNGLMPSQNPTAAAKLFGQAVELHPGMCDGWLARIVAGDDAAPVLAGAWAARETLGWETRRLAVRTGDFTPAVSDGMFVRVEITSQNSLGIAYAVVLGRDGRYADADALLAELAPTDPFDADLHSYAAGLLQ